MIRLTLFLPLLLAACGVSGPPIPPSQARQEAAREAMSPNVTISGTVGVGIGGRL